MTHSTALPSNAPEILKTSNPQEHLAEFRPNFSAMLVRFNERKTNITPEKTIETTSDSFGSWREWD